LVWRFLLGLVLYIGFAIVSDWTWSGNGMAIKPGVNSTGYFNRSRLVSLISMVIVSIILEYTPACKFVVVSSTIGGSTI
jgi:hypothetical protein